MKKINVSINFFYIRESSIVSEYLWVKLKTFHFTEHELMKIKRKIVNYRLSAVCVLIKESIE